jgi:hypothetical protein
MISGVYADLHAISPVDLRFSAVIFPDDTELQNAFRNLNDVEGLLVFRVGLEERSQTRGEFIQSLLKHSLVSPPLLRVIKCRNTTHLLEFRFRRVHHDGKLGNEAQTRELMGMTLLLKLCLSLAVIYRRVPGLPFAFETIAISAVTVTLRDACLRGPCRKQTTFPSRDMCPRELKF